MSEARVMPLADVNAIYEREMSRYPDRIRVAMEDGRVITYRLDMDDPAKQALRESLTILQKWKKENTVVGYQYEPKHAQKESLLERYYRRLRGRNDSQ